MSIKHLNLNPALYQYMLDVSLHEHPAMTALRQETSKLPLANMQIAPEQAQFMQLLLRILRAQKVLEIGTFTGYSALAMALALPEDGTVITCDLNKEWVEMGHQYWQQAKQDKKIQLRLGPALDTLNTLLNEGHEKSFDFIFIDADKTSYVEYYELSLRLIKPHGLIAIDNVFWEGTVIDPNETGGQVREIRKLNELIKNDPRVFSSLLPITDGLFLVQLK